MRKRLSCLLLAGALALSLAACATEGEAPSPTPTLPPSQPVGTETPSQPVETAAQPEAPDPSAEPPAPPEEEFSLPDRDYQPWQEGYMDFLAALQQADQDVRETSVAYGGLAVDERGIYVQNGMGKQQLTNIMGMHSDLYSLYDVDRDGVPELFVMYGNYYITQCYTFRDGQVVCVGEFLTADGSLYTHPEKDAVLCHRGRMGYYELYEYPMEDGRLTEEREIFREENVDFWTETEEIVPGAERFDWYQTQLGEWDPWPEGRRQPSAGKALLLPICDWYDGHAATGSSSEQARTSILAALNGETPFYGASGDHFYGDVGWTTWEEYIQPGGAYCFNDQPFEFVGYVWLDMNGDGQEECVLQMEEPKEETDYIDYKTVVLSEQDGTVFAYFVGSYSRMELYSDSTFLNEYGSNCRLSFWQNQCYVYTVQADAAAAPVKWVYGSPVG